ncbi:MAG: hypothetical protein J7K31_04070 [Candidatus Aenigmarchaeota archaeon]|nr:hypothetical protein [Candidatus Aenigmarchaeota archaeon]
MNCEYLLEKIQDNPTNPENIEEATKNCNVEDVEKSVRRGLEEEIEIWKKQVYPSVEKVENKLRELTYYLNSLKGGIKAYIDAITGGYYSENGLRKIKI